MYQYDGSAWVVVGDGDMKAATYDTDGDGIVDNAEKVNGHTVESDVPSDAKFTDTVYTHPTAAGNKHIPSGGATKQVLMWNADGEAIWKALVLKGGGSPDGGYRIVLDDDSTDPSAITSVTVPLASAEGNGLMSSADFSKLEGIEEGAEVNVVTAVEHETGPGVDWVEITLADGTSYAVPRIVPQDGVIGQESLPEANTVRKGIVQLATEIADGNTNVPTADMVFDYIEDLNVLGGIRSGDPGNMVVVLETDDSSLNGKKIPLLQAGTEKIPLAHLPMDTEMSETSLYPVGNKTIKQYVDNLINNLPSEQFLDLTKTTYVDSFTWNATTYPNSTNPNLDGKPVLVLALKDNDGNVQYGFVSLNDLVDVYTGDGTHIDITGGTVSHKNSGVTAGSYGDSSEKTPDFGETFKVPYVTVDEKGHITGISAHEVTIPNRFATSEKGGLMTSRQASDLKALCEGEQHRSTKHTLPAGETSITVTIGETSSHFSQLRVIAVNTYLNGEAVVCDWSASSGSVTVSIAQAINNDIDIEITWIYIPVIM